MDVAFRVSVLEVLDLKGFALLLMFMSLGS